jgi:hypothetical protein
MALGGRKPLAAVLAAGAAIAGLTLSGAPAVADNEVPPIEPDAVLPVEKEPCSLDGDKFEKRLYQLEGWKGPEYTRYPGACERLRFSYGPLVVKPGQNDVLVEPVTVQSPRRNGYLTRFKPDLVLADGTVPPVEEVHLHHGTWLSVPPYGGTVPFVASGEEKTIGSLPRGYGMKVNALDQWFMLYMVHSAIPTPMVVYITYEVDFVPESKAKEAGIKPAIPFWLDVRPSGYPVFNVQRRFGGADGTCTWPKEQCAKFDPWGEKVVGQGMPGNGLGEDLALPQEGESWGRLRNFQGGTLITMGGHLHPGGETTDVELVRGKRSKKILSSEAIYWDHKNHDQPGGPPTSWDLSMTLNGLPYWGVRVKPGDRLRINATYDTTHAATYENMGIAVGALAPHTPKGKPTAPGVDPFKAPIDRSPECQSLRKRLYAPVRKLRNMGVRDGKLCVKGVPTHGHQEANGNYGGPSGSWNAESGDSTDLVNIANFQYLPGDLSRLSMEGVPTVPLGSELTFRNLEGLAVYHSITTCKFPCLGPTGAAFPIPNGETSLGRDIDIDSGTLGIGVPVIGPTKQTLDFDVPVTKKAGFKPGETVTYFCRIHPFMRGAFKVSK